MELSQDGSGTLERSGPPRSLGQRLFARFGTAAILSAVVTVVGGWIGFLGWSVMWLLGAT
jgi:hypothetical protein